MITIITDMGTKSKIPIINDLCKYIKISNITLTAHHHQTLGTIERSHRTFMCMLVHFCRNDWDIWIRYVTYFFNTTPSVVHEYCPYEIV